MDLGISAKLFYHEVRNLLEARVGIEPTNKGFADLCLTTWLPRRNRKVYSKNTAPRRPKSNARKAFDFPAEVPYHLPNL